MKDKYVGTINHNPKMLASKWGVFLTHIFGLEHANMKDYNKARRSVGQKPIPTAWVVRDIYNFFKSVTFFMFDYFKK